ESYHTERMRANNRVQWDRIAIGLNRLKERGSLLRLDLIGQIDTIDLRAVFEAIGKWRLDAYQFVRKEWPIYAASMVESLAMEEEIYDKKADYDTRREVNITVLFVDPEKGRGSLHILIGRCMQEIDKLLLRVPVTSSERSV